MKIIFIIPNMTGGGTERVISLLSDEYVRMGYEVAIMQFAGYEHAYELNTAVEDFSVARRSGGNPVVMWKRLTAMRRYFKQNPGSRIFAFCVMGAVFSAMTTWGMERHILVAERNSPDSCNVRKLRNWAYRKADRITFQTPDGIAYFPKKIADKAVVIPNPIDASVPERYEGVRSHRVVTAGRLHKQKNHILLLNAFADFVVQYDDYELHIYGEGELERELKAHAGKLGIADKVVWHGFCANVREEIRDARMFVLSSDFEGISNSMLEALAMGLPTISTDCPIGGAKAYIEQDKSGILVPVGDRQALAQAMARVAMDDELTERLSVNAARIKDRYSVESVARRFLAAADIREETQNTAATGKAQTGRAEGKDAI